MSARRGVTDAEPVLLSTVRYLGLKDLRRTRHPPGLKEILSAATLPTAYSEAPGRLAERILRGLPVRSMAMRMAADLSA